MNDDSLTLRIPEDGEIVLPADAFTCGLSFEELGAICYWIAMASGSCDPFCKPIADDVTNGVMKRLQEEGVLYVKRTPEGITMGADFGKRPNAETGEK